MPKATISEWGLQTVTQGLILDFLVGTNCRPSTVCRAVYSTASSSTKPVPGTHWQEPGPALVD